MAPERVLSFEMTSGGRPSFFRLWVSSGASIRFELSEPPHEQPAAATLDGPGGTSLSNGLSKNVLETISAFVRGVDKPLKLRGWVIQTGEGVKVLGLSVCT